MATLLQVQGLVNRFGEQVVHQGLDMQVEEGEVFGIVGGSGAGKTVRMVRRCASAANCPDQRNPGTGLDEARYSRWIWGGEGVRRLPP